MKKLTEKELNDYKKLLKKVGYTGKYKNNKIKKIYKPEPFEKRAEYPSLKGIAYSPTKRNNYIADSKHIVGQAYNKGNFQVLTETEINDSATGKRR